MDNGAHFHRCDFQVHTPRDRQWHGEGATTDLEREEYARDFVAACRQRGIAAVAITDHHDMVFIPFLSKAALNELDSDGNPVPPEQRISIFPGMELTLGIPCQALLIFDAEFHDDMFNLVTTCLAINPAGPSEPQCNEVERLNSMTGFSKLCETLDAHTYLKGRYVILPNVSEGGNSTLLRSGHSGHYKSMPCVGGYLDHEIDKLGEGNRNILAGRDHQYGNKALALFQTSDARRRDFSELGTRSTWVKWAEPTAEALRQACLASKSRISQEQPLLPQIAITSLNVSNSSFMGPINLELNTQYNAIIGGRGTGKSTVLEYLRWALCDEPSANSDYEHPPAYDVKRDSLVRETLTALRANVQVNFIITGVPHSVRRDSANNELTLKIGNGKYEPCTESDVRNLLPIQAYSQKQLSSVGVRIEELTRFVHASIRQRLDDLNLLLNQTALEIRRCYSALQQKRAAQKEISNDERELRSVAERVATLRSQLEGIGEEERSILSKYDQYEKETEIVHTWTEVIGRVTNTLTGLKQVTSRLLTPIVDLASLPNAAILQAMQQQLTSLLVNLDAAIDDHIASLHETSLEGNPFLMADRELQGKHEEFRKAYQAAKEKSTAHETTLTQLAELETRLRLVRERVTANRATVEAAGMPEERFSDRREHWCRVHEERAELIETQCTRMSALSKGHIRATLKRGADVGGIVEQLRAAVTGANIRGTKFDSLGDVITNDPDPVRKYQRILDELELLALHDLDDPTTQELPETPILNNSGFTSGDVKKICSRLTPESWVDLCLTPMGDKPVFEYKMREEEYIPFKSASAGQQATSLLTALLNQDGVPLIIDQPEDDLDNRVVLDIVEQIWDSKQARQLIFSSHNANLVVNGDAELVACCDYRVAGEQSGGEIKLQGAIDMADIRNEITNVMEGGREAFQLRKAKYGF